MLSKINKLTLGSLTFLLPIISLAQIGGPRTGQGLDNLAVTLGQILALAAPIIMALALIYFLIGVFKYVMAAGDDEAKGAGRSMMIYGVIGLFVMASVWGLVNLLVNTFGLDTSSIPAPPVIPGGYAHRVQ